MSVGRGGHELTFLSSSLDVVELYGKRYPAARKVFNHSPESFLWSVAHRVPLAEDCRAAGKPGKLIVSLSTKQGAMTRCGLLT
jgi:hypothetical protein